MVLFFFQNIQQASFECVDSVLPIICWLVVLKVTTIEQLLEYWKIRKKFFRCLHGQANLVNKLYLELVSNYKQELDRYKKSKNFYELLDWPN